MLKYCDAKITFSEVPEEISLTISISGCPNRCPGCHSQHLWQDVGTPLTSVELCDLITRNIGISCVCLLGGDADKQRVSSLLHKVKEEFNLKTCWYTGQELNQSGEVLPYLDYIKTGPYIRQLGPLSSIDTNQNFYKIKHKDGIIILENMTFLFQKT